MAPAGKVSWDVDTLKDVLAGSWRCDSVSSRSSDSVLVVSIAGTAGGLRAWITTEVRGSGEILVSYRLDNPVLECQEAGVTFLLSGALDRFSWNRKALWSLYPDDHIGRPEGEAPVSVSGAAGEAYGRRPGQPWSRDTKDFYLFKDEGGSPPGGHPALNDFRGRKESIMSYALWSQQTGRGLRVEADGDRAARTEVRADGGLSLHVSDHWTYMNLEWGNYERPAGLERGHTGSALLRFWRPQ